MNAGDARTEILDFLNLQRNTFHKDAEVLRKLNVANRLFWRAICRVDSRHVAQYTRVSYPANTESVDLTGASYLNASFREILGIDHMTTNAAISSTNLPDPINLVHPTDLARRYLSGQPRYPGGTVVTGARLFGAIQGNSLFLAIPPTAATILRIQWVKAEPTALTADATDLLEGKAPAYHDLLWMTAAKLLSAKEKRQAPELSEIIALIRAEIDDTEDSRGGPETVGYVDPY